VAPYLRDRQLARRTGAAARSFVRSTFAPDRGAERLFAMLSEVPSRKGGEFNGC